MLPAGAGVSALLLFSFALEASSQCLFDQVVWPFGAAVVSGQSGTGGVRCRIGGVVNHGERCVFSRVGFSCETVQCGTTLVGVWSNLFPTCTSAPASQCAQPCTARGPCRGVGVCSSATGQCTDPRLPNGSLCFNGVCLSGVCVGNGAQPPAVPPAGGDVCVGWRATEGCAGTGRRLPHLDQACSSVVASSAAGYCDCTTGPVRYACGHVALSCRNVCGCTPGVTACPAPSSCHNPGVCSATTKRCEATVKPDGSACSLAGAATGASTCRQGVCVATVPQANTLYALLGRRDDARVFVRIVNLSGAASYLTTLQNAAVQSTLFVPVDTAFAALGQAELNRLTNDDGASGDVAAATAFLRAHVAQGAYLYEALPAALLNPLASANVLTRNLPATNGYVNVIDRVLPYTPAGPVPVPPTGGNTLLAAMRRRGELTVFTRLAEGSAMLPGAGGAVGSFVTVFAPSDQALAAHGLTLASVNPAVHGSLARYHAVLGLKRYNELVLTAPGVLASLDQGRVITTAVMGGQLVLDGRSRFVVRDVAADDGILHIIDQVMLHNGATPPSVPPTPTTPLVRLEQILNTRTDTATFATFLRNTGVWNEVFPTTGQTAYTVFAPTNAAMALIQQTAALSQTPNVQRILRYHFAHGGARWGAGAGGPIVDYDTEFADLVARSPLSVPTNDGGRLLTITRSAVNNGVIVNGRAGIVVSDVKAADGILHVVDYALVPDDITHNPNPAPFPVPVPGPNVPGTPPASTNTLLTLIATHPNLAQFRSFLYATRNDQYLLNPYTNGGVGSIMRYTVFAPTDAAMSLFSQMNGGVTPGNLWAGAFNMDLIVKNHISTTAALTMLRAQQQRSVPVLSGKVLGIRFQGNAYNIEDEYYGNSLNPGLIRVSQQDQVAADGILHIIDRVVVKTGTATAPTPGQVPPPPPGVPVPGSFQYANVLDVYLNNANQNYGAFVALLSETGMDQFLRTAANTNQGSYYTIFAPVDAAFTAQGINAQELVRLSRADAVANGELRRFVRQHMVRDAHQGLSPYNAGSNLNPAFTKTMQTLDNTVLTYRAGSVVGPSLGGGSLGPNTARIVTQGLLARNGVAYGIDNVVLPAGLSRLRLTNNNQPVAVPQLPPVSFPNVPTPPWNGGGWPTIPPYITNPSAPTTPLANLQHVLQSYAELSDFALLLTTYALLPMVASNRVTLFAVSNAALRGLNRGVIPARAAEAAQQQAAGAYYPSLSQYQPHQIQAILRNHIIPNQALTVSQMAFAGNTGTSYYTLQRDRITLRQAGQNVYVNNNILVRVRDIISSNGVLHVIDDVIFPNGVVPTNPGLPGAPVHCSGGQTVCSVLSQNTETRDFFLLLHTHGLLPALNGVGPYTVLAPTNAAILFVRNALATQPVSSIIAMLQNHIIVGETIRANQLASSSAGLRWGAYFNPASMIVSPNLPASNGIVHLTNTFLSFAVNGGGGVGVPTPPGVPAPPFFTPPPLPPLTFNAACGRETLCGVLSTHAELSTFAAYLKTVAGVDVGAPNLLHGLGGGQGFGAPTAAFTVFAPSNAAFRALPSGIREMLAAKPQLLGHIVRHHLVRHASPVGGAAGGVAEADLPANSPYTPLSGGTLAAVRTAAQSRTQIGTNAVITNPDLPASNGVAHVLSNVLVPDTNFYFNNEFPRQHLWDYLNGIPRFSAFVAMLNTAGLAQALQSEGPYTVFPVDNDNIAKMIPGTGTGSLGALLNDVPALRRVMMKHIFAGYFNSSVLLGAQRVYPTLGGEQVPVSQGGVPNQEQINTQWLDYVLRDKSATNGIVHSATALLFGPEWTGWGGNNGGATPAPSPVGPTLAPGDLTSCSVQANCSNLAARASLAVVAVNVTQTGTTSRAVCICDCLTGYAGTSCELCAFGYSGHPACLPVATPVPPASNGTTPTTPSPAVKYAIPKIQEKNWFDCLPSAPTPSLLFSHTAPLRLPRHSPLPTTSVTRTCLAQTRLRVCPRASLCSSLF